MAADVRNRPARLATAPPVSNSSQPTLKQERMSPRMSRIIGRSAPVLTFVVFLGLWQLAIVLGNYPVYILPPPARVAERLAVMLGDGSLQPHILTTASEAALGFLVAALGAAALAYPLAHSRLISTLLAPVLAATQAVPLVAVAPLLVLWFGFGTTPKVVTCALIVFFPLLLNAIAGLKSVDKALIEAAETFGANRLQKLWYVELPLSLPAILTGTKIGFTVAFTGAVVGEFVTADSGLGYLLNLGRGQFDTTLVFVALFTLAAIATLAYAMVSWLEKKVVTWL